MKDAELAAEQAYIDAAYERLDHLRDDARRVAAGYSETGAGGTHQARLEREAAEDHTRRRLAALDLGDQALSFGRIDLEGAPVESGASANGNSDDGPADRFYIGRISVTDDDQEPLVVDWRAPVAEPFYRATARDPMGVVRRRHFQTSGRALVGLDDEVFDSDATAAAGLEVVGEGALLSALERERTGRMHDIVATIQSEQDQAIRAELRGVLVVSGGPGTGKTAVALHRAAYLLYTHRAQLATQGMLFLGPSPVFLRYIDEVLPSLGEDEVALATVASLKPGLTVRADAPDSLAALKGSVRMVDVIAKAVRDREHALRSDLVVRLDGYRLVLDRRASKRIVDRAARRRGTHNEKRPQVVAAIIDRLERAYERALVAEYRRGSEGDLDPGEETSVAAALARGEHAPPDWRADLRAKLRAIPEVADAAWRMWPVLSGAELVNDLFGFEELVASAAKGVLGNEEQRSLSRERSRDVRDVAWTLPDVALVDEADALLGPTSAAKPRRKRRQGPSNEEMQLARRTLAETGASGFLTAEALVERYGGAGGSGDDDDGDVRRFGHVLVDEAQDLTPMEWRMIARRVPSRSMTLVGDLGQATRPGALERWEDLTDLVDREPRRVHLSVNYRTPSEIMDVAARVLAAAAPGVTPPESVRSGGAQPSFVRTDAIDDAVRDAVAAALVAGGTVAVVAPPARHDALVEALDDVGARSGPGAIDAPVGVLGPEEAKGLEFDHVVVVEPAELVRPDAAGLRLLYVTLTRATRNLAVVHSAPLPEALANGN